MTTNYIRLAWVKSAIHQCAHQHQLPFNYRRVSVGTEWVQEHKRFAFAVER